MAEQRTRDWGSCVLAILAMFLSASGWSILLRAMTVGNFSVVKASTTEAMVESDQVSRGSLRARRERVRETVEALEPYPLNWFWSVSTAVASRRGLGGL